MRGEIERSQLAEQNKDKTRRDESASWERQWHPRGQWSVCLAGEASSKSRCLVRGLIYSAVLYLPYVLACPVKVGLGESSHAKIFGPLFELKLKLRSFYNNEMNSFNVFPFSVPLYLVCRGRERIYVIL